MPQRGTVGICIVLVLAHVLMGPFCAGLVFVALHSALTDGPLMLRPAAGGAHTPFSLLMEYVRITPIFYVPGFLPALVTGLLTASQVWIKGRCSWLRAAMYGAVASIVLVGVPPLFFLDGTARSWQIGYPVTIVAMLTLQAVLGFVGTIPVWLVTGFLRRRLAQARNAPKLVAAG
jgi:hypothetical protein